MNRIHDSLRLKMMAVLTDAEAELDALLLWFIEKAASCPISGRSTRGAMATQYHRPVVAPMHTAHALLSSLKQNTIWQRKLTRGCWRVILRICSIT